MTEFTSEPLAESPEQIQAIAETTGRPPGEAASKTDRATEETNNPTAPTQPKDSYVKLAMRNMVRKGRQSLWHFFLTTVGLVGLLVGLAYLTKP